MLLSSRKKETKNRSRTVGVRVRPNEFETLKAIAESEGRTVSNTVRQLVREAMKNRDAVEVRA